jgi:predicted nucleotidyltransferase
MTDPTLDLLCDRLVAALAPRRIILFGSRARGTAEANSDYDLLVVAETDLPLEERMFQARRSVRDVRVPKDIVVVTLGELLKYSTWVSGVIRKAIDHGEVLYEAA